MSLQHPHPAKSPWAAREPGAWRGLTDGPAEPPPENGPQTPVLSPRLWDGNELWTAGPAWTVTVPSVSPRSVLAVTGPSS